MTTIGEAFVKIRPDTKGFGSQVQQDVDKPLAGIGRTVGLIAGGLAAVGVGKFLAGTVTEAVEANKVLALTAAVVKSTGGAAGLTVAQMDSLATSLSNLSGVDDEVILSSENVLATFTNVRNEVGKGNDIFSRATGAALDMSAALGTDLQGTTLQLGKALNDPIKGITALSRAGVSFTAQQKEQIKTLVESGDTLGAQKIILGELSKEFDGAAAAAANPIEKLKVVLGNAKETIGNALLPIVSQIAPLLGTVVSSLAPILSGALGGLIGALQPVIEAVLPIIGPVIETFVSLISGALKGLAPLFAPLARLFGALVPLIGTLGKALAPIVGAVSTVAGAFVNALVPILKTLAPIIGKVATILGKGIAAALKSLAPLLPPLGKAFAEILKSLAPLLPTLAKLIVAVLPLLTLQLRILTPLLTIVAQLFAVGLGEAISVVNDVLTTLLTLISEVNFDDIAGALETAGQAILDFFVGLPEQILGLLTALPGLLLQLGLALLGGLLSGIVAALPPVLAFFLELPGKIIGLFVAAASWLVDAGVRIVAGLLSGIANKFLEVLGFVIGIPGRILDALGDVATILFRAGVNIAQGLWDGLKSIWHKIEDWVSDKVDDLIHDLTHPWDIFSPSKVTTHIGEMIGLGLFEGLKSQWGKVEEGAAGLTAAASISPTVDLSATGFPRRPGRTTGSAANVASVTPLPVRPVTITITQEFNGPTDLDGVREANRELVPALTAALGQVG